MAHYPFSERKDLLVLTCTHVLEGADITMVCHHFDDNTWEFICDGQHTEEEAIVLSGLVKNPRDGIKILGDGELTKKRAEFGLSVAEGGMTK